MGEMGRIFCISILGLLFLIHFILYENTWDGDIELDVNITEIRDREMNNQSAVPERRNKENKIVVLVWTFGWGNGPYRFLPKVDPDCPRCYFTHDRSQVNKSTALLLLGQYAKPNDVPRRTDVDQVWIFQNSESPNPTYRPWSPEYDLVFNWSMTYRRDSDVWFPYGEFIHVDTLPRPQSPDSIIPSIHNFQNRSLVAWISSHCKAGSGRDEVVTGLQRHIPIDIYGECGPLKCPTSRSYSTGDDCRRHIHKQYKFYLAFENSLCVDYVTEKYFDACQTDMIPVVYGGSQYAQLFPPKSFINARDFDTVEQLARFLKLVGSDSKIWLEYFEYRKKYWVQRYNDSDLGLCLLCQKLVDRVDSGDKSRQVLNNASIFWNFGAKKVCDEPQDVPIFAHLNTSS